MTSSLLFQYCPKLVVLNEDDSTLLLCRRAGEADYDATFSLIGGKIEHKDSTIVAGIQREKTEEIGGASLELALPFCINAEFAKSDGSRMILPHFYARYLGGEIVINSEYSEYRWVALSELDDVSPLIENVPSIVRTMCEMRRTIPSLEWVRI